MRVYVVVYAMKKGCGQEPMEVVRSVHTTADGALAIIKRISYDPNWHNLEDRFATQEASDAMLTDLKAGKTVHVGLCLGGGGGEWTVSAQAFEVKDP